MSTDDRAGLEIGELMHSINAKRDRQTVFALVLFGILAGVYIGFGAFAATTARSLTDLPVGATRFLGASLFCLGLVLVVIPGSELFTGNMLMTASLVHRKISLAGVMRNWTFVWVANFVGSILLALVIFGTGLLGTPDAPTAVGKAAIDVAQFKISLPFWQGFFRGILCNMLVCLAVILVISARTTMGKIMGIYLPITTFVFCGFEHSIANMFFLPAGLLAQGKLGSDFWSMFPNLISVTLGNVVGGTLVVVLHPVRAGRIWSMIGPRRNHSGQ